jgi:hypothetical protein
VYVLARQGMYTHVCAAMAQAKSVLAKPFSAWGNISESIMCLTISLSANQPHTVLFINLAPSDESNSCCSSGAQP